MTKGSYHFSGMFWPFAPNAAPSKAPSGGARAQLSPIKKYLIKFLS